MNFKRKKGIILMLILIMTIIVPSHQVKAGTVYISDGIEYEEGYIIIGESHAVLASDAYSRFINEEHQVTGLENVNYSFNLDSSVYVDENGVANTFNMSGNLFFVYEGNASTDAEKQTSKEYIFSDGKGECGLGVRKIHEIMDTNPNVSHWNIISYHGAVSALHGLQDTEYYISSYKNWMTYEFPDASIFFVSHSTLTKFYKSARDAYKFDEAIKEAFPSQFFDMKFFYKQRYPQEMYDPDMNPDTIHWNHKTYVELFNYVINRINSEAYKEKCRLQRIRLQAERSKFLACKNACY